MSVAAHLNALTEPEGRAALTRCCGSRGWVEKMLFARPFQSDRAVFDAADRFWGEADEADILEAFGHHPRIGASLDALRKKFSSTADWSANEQASVAGAQEGTIIALRDGNVAYEERYGFIFIVCATGKSAAEMLEILQSRMSHTRDQELRIAAGEQGKITKLRLEKLS